MGTPILILDDDPGMGSFLAEALPEWGFEAAVESVPERVLERLARGDFRAVVTDVRMRGLDGIEVTRTLTEERPDLPVVVMTAFGSVEGAVEAMRAGAADFLTKPFEAEVLALTLRRVVRQRSLEEEVTRLRREVAAGGTGVPRLVGRSRVMGDLRALLTRIAEADAPVLITGETGTGKELVARVLHARGPQSEGPFVALNCAAIPAELLESELFGHEKGAFSGADRPRPGLLREADGGSFFLDEVAELPLELQPKLLRALQERRVRPVGSAREVPFRARVLAATHRDLEGRARDGVFRQDLLYRLNVLPVEVPPLRRRESDVLELAEHFLESHPMVARRGIRGFGPEACESLLAYSWPGNVRELQNCVERAVALAASPWISRADLPELVRRGAPTRDVESPGGAGAAEGGALSSMAEVEERHIRRVLVAVGWNKTRAAEVLGFDRKTLYRKLDRYAIRPP